MDENRLYGTARNVEGKVEEGVGRATGDVKTRIQGKLDQATGTAQDLYGQTADAARDTAANLDKWLRNTIETQPYSIGWLLGRMHRPLCAAIAAGVEKPPTGVVTTPWNQEP